MTHHVEHRPMADNGAKQIGTLRQSGTDQQTAIACARNRELRRLRIAIRDQPFCACDEIIDTFCLRSGAGRPDASPRRIHRRRGGLLTRKRRRLRPKQPPSSSKPETGLGRIRRSRSAKVGRAESSVKPSFVEEIHRNPGSVLQRIPDLPQFELSEVGNTLLAPPDVTLPGICVVAVDRR